MIKWEQEVVIKKALQKFIKDGLLKIAIKLSMDKIKKKRPEEGNFKNLES